MGMKTFKTIMIAIGIMVVSGCLFAAQIQVTWNANTEEDLAGYRLYVGKASGQYGEPVDVGNVTEYVMEITPQHGATYYFALTAYDTSGNESGYSDEASVFIKDSMPPSNPKSLLVKIVEAIISWLKSVLIIA
jgi:fibronectin type 3 domain-containing protein